MLEALFYPNYFMNVFHLSTEATSHVFLTDQLQLIPFYFPRQLITLWKLFDLPEKSSKNKAPGKHRGLHSYRQFSVNLPADNCVVHCKYKKSKSIVPAIAHGQEHHIGMIHLIPLWAPIWRIKNKANLQQNKIFSRRRDAYAVPYHILCYPSHSRHFICLQC